MGTRFGLRKRNELRLAAVVATVALAGMLSLPSLSTAAVTLGPLDTALPGNGSIGACAAACTRASRTAPSLTLAAPFDGVLVRWRIRVPSPGSPATWRLRVVRETAVPGLLTGAGTGAGETVTPGLEQIFEARLPISAGELVGVDGPPAAVASLAIRSIAGGTLSVWSPSLADGDPGRSPTGSGSGFVGLYNADLEADCDSDGFGDETQDLDTASCLPDTTPPETTITNGPKSKSKKRTATFEFSGTDARALAGFECALDGASFAPCTTPYEVKVKRGKHTFSVRATDAAGNVDGAPATAKWKVKKKKK